MRGVPSVYRNIVNFTGKTGRSQFWADVLVLIIATIVFAMITVKIGPGEEVKKYACTAFAVINMVALSATMTRRFRDAGYPPFQHYLIIIPIVGPILMLIRLCMPAGYCPYQRTMEMADSPEFSLKNRRTYY